MLSRARVLAAAVAAVASLSPVRAQEIEKVRIVGVPTDDMTPIFYAIGSGLYRRAGLDVEVVTANSGTASTVAIVAGAYELGKGSPMASLLAHARGLPLTIVANGALWMPKRPFNLVLTASDSPVRTAADCNGRIASTAALNDIGHLGVLLWVDKNGGDSRTVKWVEIPNGAATAALIEHRVDLTTLNEPLLTASLETGKVRAIGDAFGTIGERWVSSVYFAQPNWAAKHADALRRWVRATYEAAAYTNAHEPETVPMMAEITKIPLDVFQKMARIAGSTTSDPSLLQPVMDLGLRYKVLQRAFPLKELYNPI